VGLLWGLPNSISPSSLFKEIPHTWRTTEDRGRVRFRRSDHPCSVATTSRKKENSLARQGRTRGTPGTPAAVHHSWQFAVQHPQYMKRSTPTSAAHQPSLASATEKHEYLCPRPLPTEPGAPSIIPTPGTLACQGRHHGSRLHWNGCASTSPRPPPFTPQSCTLQSPLPSSLAPPTSPSPSAPPQDPHPLIARIHSPPHQPCAHPSPWLAPFRQPGRHPVPAPCLQRTAADPPRRMGCCGKGTLGTSGGAAWSPLGIEYTASQPAVALLDV